MEQPSKTSPRNHRAKLAYNFFQQYEHTQQSFTAADLAQATGYKIATVNIYLSKKWWWFLVNQQGRYTVQGIARYSLEDFLHDLSQKAKEPLPAPDPLWKADFPHSLCQKAGEPSPAPDPLWKQDPLAFPLATAFISLCMLWAAMLLLLRKRPWWILPL
jgi:hypothetical protein